LLFLLVKDFDIKNTNTSETNSSFLKSEYLFNGTALKIFILKYK